MTTTSQQLKNILTWSAHIATGKLGHDEFDMTCYHSEINCHTVGCAIGELPTIFPKQFRLLNDDISTIVIHRETQYRNFDALLFDFGINNKIAKSLFSGTYVSRLTNNITLPHSILSRTNTRKAIAASMRRYVAWRRKGLK